MAFKLYHMFVKYSVWMKEGGWKARLYKKGIKLYPDKVRPMGTIVMPLNVDLTDAAEKTVVPLDMIKESLKSVGYIAGMDSCLCRDANDCADFPHDLGRQLSYEEACAKVDKAAEAGLMGQAVWIEVEQMLWGVPHDLMDHFLEICFCCPCCCITMKLARNATEKERHRFHPAGWIALADTTKCVGCGICRTRCTHDAIQIKQTMPMRRDLQEYFLKDYNIDLKLGK